MTATLKRLEHVNLRPSDRMPALFIGHGGPMNAIQDTGFSRGWTEIGGAPMRAAHPAVEHFLPLLYTLAVADDAD